MIPRLFVHSRVDCGLRGFEPVTAKTGEEGFFLVSRESFDIVILDWMLPGRDGIEVLSTLRAAGSKTPVLLLTARDAIEDRVLGLNAGADDYLVRPFAFAELLARVRALMRRIDSGNTLRQQIGDLTLDMQTRRVVRGAREIALRSREFDLLAFLAQHHDETVTRQMIAREVWREPNRATPLDNVIDVHLAHLRRKLDDGEDVKLIQTVRGVGFVFRDPNRWPTRSKRRKESHSAGETRLGNGVSGSCALAAYDRAGKPDVRSQCAGRSKARGSRSRLRDATARWPRAPNRRQASPAFRSRAPASRARARPGHTTLDPPHGRTALQPR